MGKTTRKARLVVIGGGGSGLCAAVTAMQNGVKDIVVLEKSHFFGGNSRMAGGHLFGPQTQENCDTAFHVILAANHYKVEAKNLRAFINNSRDTVEFFNSIGIPYHYGSNNANFMDNGPHPFGNFVQATRKMCAMLRAAGHSLLAETWATAIERDEVGRVCRVLAENSAGEEFLFDTEAAVITTGGFGGNRELLHHYFPHEYSDHFFSDALPNDGSGIDVARSAGAKLNEYAVMIKENAYSCDSYNGAPNRAAHNPNSLWVNRMGERFADESYTKNESSNSLVRQPDKIGYALYDADSVSAPVLAQGRTGSFANTMGDKTEQANHKESVPGQGVELNGPPADFNRIAMEQEARRSGEWVCIAEDLETIADWMGCDRVDLLRTVEEYNQDCETGRDRLFCKDPAFLLPLRRAPYYAIKFRPLLIDTIGPIVVNENMQVLGQDNKPIAGLYAAGVCTAGWQGNDFHSCGWALGYATTSGRIAEKSIAARLA